MARALSHALSPGPAFRLGCSLCLRSCLCWELRLAKGPLPPPGSWWHLGPDSPLAKRGDCEQTSAPRCLSVPPERAGSFTWHFTDSAMFSLLPHPRCSSIKWMGLAYDPHSTGQESKIRKATRVARAQGNCWNCMWVRAQGQGFGSPCYAHALTPAPGPACLRASLALLGPAGHGVTLCARWDHSPCDLSSSLIKLLPRFLKVGPGLDPVKCRSHFAEQHDTVARTTEMSVPTGAETHFWELGLWK